MPTRNIIKAGESVRASKLNLVPLEEKKRRNRDSLRQDSKINPSNTAPKAEHANQRSHESRDQNGQENGYRKIKEGLPKPGNHRILRHFAHLIGIDHIKTGR